MLVYGTFENSFVIVRVTPSGRMTFYTGRDDSTDLSAIWNCDRKKALKLDGRQEQLLVRAARIPRSHADAVHLIPSELVDQIIRWGHDDRGRERRTHRATRAMTRSSAPNTEVKHGQTPSAIRGLEDEGSGFGFRTRLSGMGPAALPAGTLHSAERSYPSQR